MEKRRFLHSKNGVRVCVSQMNREEQYDLLDRRLRDFAQDYARK